MSDDLDAMRSDYQRNPNPLKVLTLKNEIIAQTGSNK